jgi:hypothetical protein
LLQKEYDSPKVNKKTENFRNLPTKQAQPSPTSKNDVESVKDKKSYQDADVQTSY